jgi:hypothetical protein
MHLATTLLTGLLKEKHLSQREDQAIGGRHHLKVENNWLRESEYEIELTAAVTESEEPK